MSQKRPIILSDNATQHLPLADTDTLKVSSIPLSADDGQMIQVREDGIYYGIVAPADIQNQYVSTSLGNDTSGDGTRAKPYKTVQRALDIIQDRAAGGVYYILLRAGEDFTIDRHTWFSNATYSVSFRGYDDPKYGDAYDRAGYWVSCIADYSRPTLVVDTYSQSSGIIGTQAISGTPQVTQLHFGGCNIIIRNTAGASTGGGWFFYCDVLILAGCNVTQYADWVGFSSAKSIICRNLTVAIEGAAPLFIADYGPNVFCHNAIEPGATNTDPYGEFQSGVGKTANWRSYFTPDNIMGMTTYDAATKTLFGYQTNWDIFKGGN
jgi:hypothetical protein